MRFHAILLLALLPVLALAWALASALTSNSSPPTAKYSLCASALMADWSADGRIDRTYAGPCYYRALDSLPNDLRAYSSAADDIRRALQSSGR